MFRAKFVQTLATLQFMMLLLAGASAACGRHMSMKATFWPLELLVFIAVVFWGVFAGIVQGVRNASK